MTYQFKKLDNTVKDSEFVIFSVFRQDLSEWVNIENTIRFKNMMIQNGISYKEVEGMYQGVKEVSFLIKLDDFLQIEHIVFEEFKQECVCILGILLKNTYRTARMRFKSGKEIKLGFFKQVSKDKALTKKGYTFDYSANNWYIIEKSPLNIVE